MRRRNLFAGAVWCAAVLAVAGCTGAPTVLGPTTATVPFAYPSLPLATWPPVTVTQVAAGPPTWGYKIVGGVTPGPAPLPAAWNRISLDFDVPCSVPKSSGGIFKIIPSAGPAQHYVLIYARPTTSAVITVVCDAKPTGSARIEMLDAGLHAYERGAVTVAGPGR